jgi:hypothetical protein
MRNGVVDIDHLMISVHDSQRAGETFARMGFTVTPRSALPGMSNRLICFPPVRETGNNFIEFLGFDDRAKAPSIMHEILGEQERPVSMVMVTGNARAAESALRESGFAPAPVMHFRRDWRLPSGEVISPEFEVCLLRSGTSPLTWNLCQYLNAEVYQRPDFNQHRNGAKVFAAVLAVAEDVEAVAAHFASAWGCAVETLPSGGRAVVPQKVALRLMTPAQAAQAYPGVSLPQIASGAAYLGFAIGFADIERARAELERAQIPHRSSAAGLPWIAPEHAHGCLVAFERA